MGLSGPVIKNVAADREDPSARRSGLVDLVRSFSILAVMALHLMYRHGPANQMNDLLDWIWFKFQYKGQLGVSVFFVVSGFLITRRLEKDAGGVCRPNLRMFYVKRVGRILPLLMVICILGWVVVNYANPSNMGVKDFFRLPVKCSSGVFWLSVAAFGMNWLNIFVNSDMGAQWALLWSLAIEEQFYFFYPMGIRLLESRRKLYLFLIFFVLMGHVGRELYFQFKPGYTLYAFTSFEGFEYIAMGCLLCLFTKDHWKFIGRHLRVFSILSSAGLGLMVFYYSRPFYKADYWGRVWGPTFFGVGLCLFLLAGLHWKWPNGRVVYWLGTPGRLSYGMYLWHPMVLFIFYSQWAKWNVFDCYILFVIFTGGAAFLSERWFEVPVNRWVRMHWEG